MHTEETMSPSNPHQVSRLHIPSSTCILHHSASILEEPQSDIFNSFCSCSDQTFHAENRHQCEVVVNGSNEARRHIQISVEPEESCDNSTETDPLVTGATSRVCDEERPRLVISQHISSSGSASPLSIPLNFMNTTSSIYNLPVFGSAASLYTNDNASSLFRANSVVRSVSAYAYPNLHLPIPSRSPGMSPISRISFSTYPDSSLESSVETPFGGSHIIENSSLFGSPDIRINERQHNTANNAQGSQGATSGLLVSLSNLNGAPEPPLYSPPPTYDQVGNHNITIHELDSSGFVLYSFEYINPCNERLLIE